MAVLSLSFAVWKSIFMNVLKKKDQKQSLQAFSPALKTETGRGSNGVFFEIKISRGPRVADLESTCKMTASDVLYLQRR